MTENEVSSTPEAKTNPSVGYGSMAGILIGESQKFLQTILAAGNSAGTTGISTDFLLKFLASADDFSTQCSQKLASLLKESSSLAEIRETPDAVLARLVRSRAFESVDSILIQFVTEAKAAGLGSNLNLGNLAESRVREAGLGEAMNASSDETEKKPRSSTPQIAKTNALVHAFCYTSGLEVLAHDFLDYGGGRLLGNEADFNMMNQFIQNVRDSIYPNLSETLAYMEGFEAVRKKKWDDMRAAESEAIRSGVLQATQTSSLKTGGFVSLLFAGLCGIPIWIVLTNGISNQYVLGVTAAFALIGVVLFFRGIIRLTNG